MNTDPGPPTPPATSVRRPRQARSIARREKILAAAERVLVEQGYGAVTTSSVARTANVPVGSVYQYFHDKQTLLDELAAGYLAEFDVVFEDLEGEEEPGSDPVRQLLDRFVGLIRDRPGFRALWLERRLSEVGLAADRASTDRIAVNLAALVARRRHREATEVDLLRCQVVVEAADALLQQAFRRDPAGDESFLEQSALLLRRYVLGWTEPPLDK